MKCIVKGQTVLIDDEDIEIFNRYNWHINDSGYAVWRGVEDGKKKTIRLHRLIAKPADGLVVDHINRNKLDNRRGNLRCVTPAINALNKDVVDNARGYYYSTSKRRASRPWVVDCRGISNSFKTEEDAIEAVRKIRNGTFVKRKDIIHEFCQKHGDKKQWYGSCWVCRRCILDNCRRYYKRKQLKKKGELNAKTKKGD